MRAVVRGASVWYLAILVLMTILSGCSSGSEETKSSKPNKAANNPYTVHCSEPLPEFTLGKDSSLTKKQERALCECIWENLGQWEREIAKKISQGKESDLSKRQKRAFPSRFGSAVKKCGGMNL